jgi:hypothetical protein
MLVIGRWIETGLTHDWVGGDFMVSQLIEAVGLAFAITSVIAFAAANVTPARRRRSPQRSRSHGGWAVKSAVR